MFLWLLYSQNLAAHLKAYKKFLIKHRFNESETIEIIDWVLKGILVFNQSLKTKKSSLIC